MFSSGEKTQTLNKIVVYTRKKEKMLSLRHFNLHPFLSYGDEHLVVGMG